MTLGKYSDDLITNSIVKHYGSHCGIIVVFFVKQFWLIQQYNVYLVLSVIVSNSGGGVLAS